MKCDFCGRKARRYEVSVWDSEWNWPIKSETTKSLAFSYKISARLAKLGPNVGMTATCRNHK